MADHSLQNLVKAMGKLHEVGSVNFRFPRIIAIGAQSAGKSSVLEEIIGEPFLPRGTGIVTRCPIFVILHQSPAGTTPKAKFDEDAHAETSNDFVDFEDVKQEIVRRTHQRVKDSKDISHEEIKLHIYSPKYPDLQIIDLPGFTQSRMDDQAEDIVSQIEVLNKKYMEDPNTIILAIQDSSLDLPTSPAILQAEKADPEKRRTTGVLTKMDKISNDEKRQDVTKILNNKKKYLELGWFGVIANTQTEVPDDEFAKKKGEATKGAYESVADRLGFDNLRKFLTSKLAQEVKMKIPGLKAQITKELKSIKEELSKEGGKCEDKDTLINNLVLKCMAKITRKIEGLDSRVANEPTSTGNDLNRMIKEGLKVASEEVRIIENSEEFAKFLTGVKKKIHGIHDDLLDNEQVFDIAVSRLTEHYREPFKRLLLEVTKKLKEDVCQTINETLSKFPKFEEVVVEIATKHIDEKVDKTEEYLDVLIDMQRNHINSDHPQFKSLKKNAEMKKKKRAWMNRAKKSVKSTVTQIGEVVGQVAEVVTKQTGGGVTGAVLGAATGGLVNTATVGVATTVFGAIAGESQEKDSSGSGASAKEKIDLDELDHVISYIEIIEVILEDSVQKLFIMMLPKKMLVFLKGEENDGKEYGPTFLSLVLRGVKDFGDHDKLMAKDALHEEHIKSLKKKEKALSESLKMLEEAVEMVNDCMAPNKDKDSHMTANPNTGEPGDQQGWSFMQVAHTVTDSGKGHLNYLMGNID